MIIGVISDTHDNFRDSRKAAEIFKEKKIQTILHAGDLENPAILEIFHEFEIYLTHGNVDPDIAEINQKLFYMKKSECRVHYDIQLHQKNILLTHGDNIPYFRAAVESGNYHYIIKGHTHFPEDYRRNNIRILNPGALARASQFTIGILDLRKDQWNIIEL